ncbi:MAG: hypothetical protein ACYSXF_00015 [Planctomycetota bacterium]|jgi:hypothetical protein
MVTKKRFSAVLLIGLCWSAAALMSGCAAASHDAALASAPAPGFDVEGSDPEAVALAKDVMRRMGGAAAWDRTRYLTWSFFGRRRHVWDKHTGQVRIDVERRKVEEPVVILMNVNTKKGRAWKGSAEVADPDELAELLDTGEAAWINDSYWLVMPYKLLDSGVTLHALGEGTMADGRSADILELTFYNVGRTPENKYHVYVDRESGLVEQWAFFAEREDQEPRFVCPWANWKRYGRIMLSGDRGDRGQLTDIAVLDALPESVLTSPATVDWERLLDRARP